MTDCSDLSCWITEIIPKDEKWESRRSYQCHTQSPISGSKQLYSVRNSISPTIRQICRCEICEPAREDASIHDYEFGDITIEIQHFCGAPSWCKVLPPVVLVCCWHSGAPSTRPVELHIGNIPVVLCGIPSRELNATGLPISSSVPSLKETLTHEYTWRISAVSTSRRLLFPMAAVKMTKSEII